MVVGDIGAALLQHARSGLRNLDRGGEMPYSVDTTERPYERSCAPTEAAVYIASSVMRQDRAAGMAGILR